MPDTDDDDADWLLGGACKPGMKNFSKSQTTVHICSAQNPGHSWHQDGLQAEFASVSLSLGLIREKAGLKLGSAPGPDRGPKIDQDRGPKFRLP